MEIVSEDENCIKLDHNPVQGKALSSNSVTRDEMQNVSLHCADFHTCLNKIRRKRKALAEGNTWSGYLPATEETYKI